MIHINYLYGEKLRKQINEYRQKNNIPVPEDYKKIVFPVETFLEEELLMVSSLNFDINDKLSQEEIQRIINLCPNIKSLSISNQEQIRSIDISGLLQLQDLTLTSNYNLHNVKGLENQKDLFSLTFYNNIAYGKSASKKLCNYVIDNICNNGMDCNLDIMLLPEIMELKGINNIDMNLLNLHLDFTECLLKNRDDRLIKYSALEAEKPYKKARDIINTYLQDGDTTIQKYAVLYQWMNDNVKYDKSALESNSLSHNDLGGLRIGKRYGSQGTANALLYGTSVCQGYTNTMRLLLKMADIPAFDIHCFGGSQESLEQKKGNGHRIEYQDLNHSLLKVNLDGKIYYSDVTWDADKYQRGQSRNYFLLSYSDVSKDHVLYESNIPVMVSSVDALKQEDLLNFASNRIKNITPKKKIENRLGVAITDFYTVIDGDKLVNILKSSSDLKNEYLMMDYNVDHSYYSKTLFLSNDDRKEIKEELKKVYDDMIQKREAVEKTAPKNSDKPVNTSTPPQTIPIREIVRKPGGVSEKNENTRSDNHSNTMHRTKYAPDLEKLAKQKQDLIEQKEELINKRVPKTPFVPQYDEFGVEISKINEEMAKRQQIEQTQEVGRRR